MTNFISFVALMATLVVGLALLSVAFAVVVGIALRAFRGNA
jgi:hypothetical protein